MNQLRILLHDGSSLILHEDELFNDRKKLWQRTCIEQRIYSWN